MHIRCRYIPTTLVIIACSSALAAEIYVSPGGDDGNSGTRLAPLRTVQKAADILGPGDICRLLPGRYREAVTIHASGNEGRPIRIVADSRAKVVFDGTQVISGTWSQYRDGIWKTKVEFEFDQLFLDGKMMIAARWPNVRFKDLLNRSGWASTGKGSRYGSIVDPQLAAIGLDASDALVTFNHQFLSWTRPVVHHEARSDTLNYPKDIGLDRLAGQTKIWKDDFYYLSGTLNALDAPGEWFLDRKSKTLYLKTLDGGSPAGHNIAAKIRALAISVKGSQYVNLERVEFFACTFCFERCDHCLVDGCHLIFPTYSNGMGDSGESATVVVGDDNTIRNSSLAFSSTGGFTMQGSHNVIENCLVHDVCWDGSLTHVGIKMAGGHDSKEGGCVVRRNCVFNCGNSCVTIGSLPDCIVELNDIHDGGLLCSDVSLLYTQLPTVAGTVFRYNWVHGCHAPQIALGIRGDDQTRGLIVHHNVVWDCGWAGIVVKGDRNIVCNNTVFGSGKSDIILRSRAEPAKSWRQQWPLLAVQNQNTVAYNNCAGSATSGVWSGPPLACQNGNNYFGPDPKLVDPEHLDFRPCANSPLVDAGREISGITTSFVGKAPDIGAYEFGGTRWTPGPNWSPQAFYERLYDEVLW